MRDIIIIGLAILVGYVGRVIYERWRDRDVKR